MEKLIQFMLIIYNYTNVIIFFFYISNLSIISTIINVGTVDKT